MSRLTEKKFLDNFKAMKNIAPDYVASKEELMYEKLGKLEDLEEQLGFSLEKLNETNHIYATDCKNVRKYEIIGVNFKEKKIWFWDDFCPMFLEFGDYKKQFWLKEDKSE